MTLLEILNLCKPICRLDLDDTEFDTMLKTFINDTISDLYRDMKQPIIMHVAIVNGQAKVDNKYKIVKIDPVLEPNDEIIGNTIITSLTGNLSVYVIDMPDDLVNDIDNLDLSNNVIRLIPYNVASLWYAFKKKTDLSMFWINYYNSEKSKRIEKPEAEETYQMDLPYSSDFNYD